MSDWPELLFREGEPSALTARVDIAEGQTVASDNTGQQGVCALAAEPIPVGTPIAIDGQGYARPDREAAFQERLARALTDPACPFCTAEMVDGRCPGCGHDPSTRGDPTP